MLADFDMALCGPCRDCCPRPLFRWDDEFNIAGGGRTIGNTKKGRESAVSPKAVRSDAAEGSLQPCQEVSSVEAYSWGSGGAEGGSSWLRSLGRHIIMSEPEVWDDSKGPALDGTRGSSGSIPLSVRIRPDGVFSKSKEDDNGDINVLGCFKSGDGVEGSMGGCMGAFRPNISA